MSNSISSNEGHGAAVIPAAQARLEDALLLDVRTPAEYGAAHVEGSVLHPLASLDVGEVRRLLDGKRACLIICRSGARARQAAQTLVQAGIPGVEILEGGIIAWEAAGRPVVHGEGRVISLERQVRIAAGALVLTGVLLGALVHPAWIALSGFVGAGLVFAGVTDTCGMGLLLARMPWNQRQ